METVYEDYSPKGVKFLYIYKALAHPELNGYVKPFTLDERLMHVKEAQRTLGSKITWIADSMSNDIKHALGNRENSEFVIDPDGKIVRMRSWSNPEQLRKDLTELEIPVLVLYSLCWPANVLSFTTTLARNQRFSPRAIQILKGSSWN